MGSHLGINVPDLPPRVRLIFHGTGTEGKLEIVCVDEWGGKSQIYCYRAAADTVHI